MPTFWVPKVRFAGVSFTAVAVPLRPIVWGLFDALSMMAMVPVIIPEALGENATDIVQLPFASTEPLHVFDTLKFVVLDLIMVMVKV